VAAWGHNLDGELGDGSMVNRPIPVLVSGIATGTAIDAGGYHGLAVLADGSVRAWGYNGQGQLGDGTTTLRTAPVEVSGLNTAVAVAGGDYHSLALLSDGTVRAWGSNASGQLGDGTLTQRKTPVAVPDLTGVAQIAAGTLHSVARKTDGTVWTWGDNSSGALGLGDMMIRSTPQQVPGITTAVEIVAAGGHTLVRLADGTARVFGDNTFGQLGDGTTTTRLSPVPLPGISGITSIGGGAFHSFFFAPAPPAVTISAVSGIATTTATLHGTVNPSSVPTTAQFEYGVTNSYGSNVPLVLASVDGNMPQTVSAALTGLLPGKTYFYRLTATNGGGTAFLAGSFTTRSAYTQWKLDFFQDADAPDNGDPDFDRVPNIAEYLTGSHPLVPSTPIKSSLANGHLAITFPRNTAAIDVTATVQASDNFVTWTDIAASDRGAPTIALVAGVEVIESGAGPILTVEVRDAQLITDLTKPRRFLRVQLSR
jgi:hypothetical protein